MTLLVCCLLAGAALAQVLYGSLAGTGTDPAFLQHKGAITTSVSSPAQPNPAVSSVPTLETGQLGLVQS